MRIEQIETIQDAQEWAAAWGYVIIEQPHEERAKLVITNNGGTKRCIYHEYKDLEHLKTWLHTYTFPPGSDEWMEHRDRLLKADN